MTHYQRASRSAPEHGEAAGEAKGDRPLIRPFREGDEAQVLDVYRAATGGNWNWYVLQRQVDPEAYLRWFVELHESFPQGSLLVTEIGSRIVAVSGALDHPIKVGTRVVQGGLPAIGAATHPDFRGRGFINAMIARRLATEPLRGASLQMSTMRRRNRPDPTKLDLKNELSVFLHVRHPLRAARARSPSLIGNVLAFGAYMWLGLLGRLRSRPGPRASWSVTTVDGFDERFEAFWEQASRPWDFIPVRTKESLNWRYCDPRAGSFVVRAAEEGGSVLGYAVLADIGGRMGRGHIVDLLALPDRNDVVRSLVDDALRFFDAAGATGVECWMMRQHPYVESLRQVGFVRLGPRSAEINRGLIPRGAGLEAEERALVERRDARIHIVEGDSDSI